jgi:hypothetical protein
MDKSEESGKLQQHKKLFFNDNDNERWNDPPAVRPLRADVK